MNEPTTPVHFENAPIVEMIQGLYFAPLKGWDLLDYGLLWQKLAPRYSRHEFKPPFGEMPQLQGQIVTAVQQQDLGKFPVRCWFVDESEAEIVQVQDTCLIHNWRKLRNSDSYPGYQHVRSHLAEDWRTFCIYLDERGIPAPDLLKCELSYIDQFVRGAEWKSFADLSKLYRLWRGMETAGPLSSLEFASFVVNYALPDGTTKLVFSSQPAVRPIDGKEIIQLTITATGRPSNSSEKDVLDWLDRAHASIIDGFINFTAPEVQEYWRRTK